ncbi:30S ribosome-binding factor RbfA [Candidatus Endowatersipora endosymbiont of Watersipora subatra]|uniref:30S ribosome-binding factor RbfA n=1 Tax=Candidatus Endowatersipora endosymbiont of Watersipora subatra TaxID=3077946 RepID=UPI00312C6FBE
MLKNKMLSQRQLRSGELIRHALAEIIGSGQILDSDLLGEIFCVSEVRMSRDLRIAVCYVSSLGTSKTKEIVKALTRNMKFIRGRVASKLNNMKYIPRLCFIVDESFNNFSKIDHLLKSERVAKDISRLE